VCSTAGLVLQLDGTLVTVALPSVAHELRVSVSSSADLLSAYFGAYALLLIPGGMLVDRFGVRRVALAGLGLFLAGAAAGAAAGGLGLLIVARLVQGAGAGVASPAALAGAVSGFPPEQRGVPLGIWGASTGLANLIGPLLGGALTDLFGWRADWWALVPLSLVAAGAIVMCVPVSRSNDHSERHRAPLNRAVLSASFVAAVTFAVMIGPFYLIEQYLQESDHHSPLAASAVLAFVALLVAVAAPIAGRLTDTRGERLTATLGFVLVGLGLALLGTPEMPLGSAVSFAALAPLGVGLGLLFVPTSRAGLNSAPDSSHGRVSAILSLGRLLGAMIGAAAAGAAISGGTSASITHQALLVTCAACILLGVPAASRLGKPAQPIG
jgi:MFS transporter, DHA2 family, methylenomycin A resistance protein